MSKRFQIYALFFIPILAGAVLYAMGRNLICSCGYIKFWHGVVFSSENSQHLFDWYTFTHIVHGLLFYFILSIIERVSKLKIPFLQKLLIAVLVESGWEILENTNYVINRYRSVTISLDYFGDSVINSLGDILAMAVGFIFAYKKSVWISVGLFLLLELSLLYFIRDNLTINIIMLIHPIEALKLWQAGG